MFKIYRPTWAEISLEAINANLDYVKSLNPNKIAIPVIKADAYGHGAVEVMNFLYQKGVKIFAVSLLEEAIELRLSNKHISILMLGPILESQFEVAEKNDIDITLNDTQLIESILKTDYHIKVHLKIDTGMNRYGLKDKNEILDSILRCQKHKSINLVGLYTHFSTANENKAYYDLQLERFKEILKDVEVKPEMIHISNSSSSIKYENNYDFTTHYRLGISLYGLTLDKQNKQLEPAFTLKSKIVQIKDLKPGEAVGYGASYTAVADEKIGIIPIGYADGWLRVNKRNQVEINHKRYQTVGIICMDATFIRIDDLVNIGDEVTLFGGLISTDEVAQKQRTIVYEVCTNISKRVPRQYIKGEKE